MEPESFPNGNDLIGKLPSCSWAEWPWCHSSSTMHDQQSPDVEVELLLQMLASPVRADAGL